jgi:hypothetical protein
MRSVEKEFYKYVDFGYVVEDCAISHKTLLHSCTLDDDDSTKEEPSESDQELMSQWQPEYGLSLRPSATLNLKKL